MSILNFAKTATKEQAKLRLAITGPSGSGKTYSGINILMEMGCENPFVIDTEYGSAKKYAKSFKRPFTVVDNEFWKDNYDARVLTQSLREIGKSGKYDGVFVDSLSHFWFGKGGIRDFVEAVAKRAAARGGRADSFAAWKEGDAIYQDLIQAILGLPCHFVAGLRAKTEYTRTEENGRTKVTKTGMQAQIRDGFEYEFDVEGMMDMDHNFIVGKTRCSALDGKIFPRPGANIAEPLVAWLTDGVAPPPKAEPEPTPLASVARSGADPSPEAIRVSPFEGLKAELEAASDDTARNEVTAKIQQAKKDKQLSVDELKVLGELFQAQKKAS